MKRSSYDLTNLGIFFPAKIRPNCSKFGQYFVDHLGFKSHRCLTFFDGLKASFMLQESMPSFFKELKCMSKCNILLQIFVRRYKRAQFTVHRRDSNPEPLDHEPKTESLCHACQASPGKIELFMNGCL